MCQPAYNQTQLGTVSDKVSFWPLRQKMVHATSELTFQAHVSMLWGEKRSPPQSITALIEAE